MVLCSIQYSTVQFDIYLTVLSTVFLCYLFFFFSLDDELGRLCSDEQHRCSSVWVCCIYCWASAQACYCSECDISQSLRSQDSSILMLAGSLIVASWDQSAPPSQEKLHHLSGSSQRAWVSHTRKCSVTTLLFLEPIAPPPSPPVSQEHTEKTQGVPVNSFNQHLVHQKTGTPWACAQTPTYTCSHFWMRLSFYGMRR